MIDVLESSERALWLCAHPDDENSSGGLIARARELCDGLYMASLTKGENSGGPDGGFVWDGLRLGSEIGASRAALFAQAGEIFGADDTDVGPFVNGPHSLEYLDAMTVDTPYTDWPRGSRSTDVISKWSNEGDPVGYIATLLRRWRPNVVMAMDHWCGVSGHPEHLAVTRLLFDAVKRAASPSDLSGDPWSVSSLIVNAHVLPRYRDLIVLHKAEGKEPQEPVVAISAMDLSAVHGVSYHRVATRVRANYANTMTEMGRSADELETLVDEAEATAQNAFSDGSRDFPLVEPYRLIDTDSLPELERP